MLGLHSNCQLTTERSLTSAPHVFTLEHLIDNWFNMLRKAFETAKAQGEVTKG